MIIVAIAILWLSFCTLAREDERTRQIALRGTRSLTLILLVGVVVLMVT